MNFGSESKIIQEIRISAIRKTLNITAISKCVVVYIFYLGILIANISSHEMWRDETDAWLVARDSKSVLDLLDNVRYTGRPPLWYLLLYATSRLNQDVILFKLLTVLISALTLALIVFGLEFSLHSKILLLSGFYFLFGFSVLSRDYLLILLLIVSLNIVYQSKNIAETKMTRILLLCLPLTAINVFGMLVVVAILISITIITFTSLIENARNWIFPIALAAINLIWLLLMIIISRPPKDHFFAVNPPYEVTTVSLDSLRVIFWKSIGFFAQAIFPFWNNFQVTHFTVIPSILGILIIVFIVKNLQKELKIFAVFVTGIFYLFHIFGYSPFWWHRGTLSIILVLVGASLFSKPKAHLRNIGVLAAYILLVIQISGSIFGLGRTFWGSSPYSNAFIASEFLNKICKENYLVIAENDLTSSAISAYMQKHQFYYLNRDEFGTFTSWKSIHFGKRVLSWDDVVLKSRSLVPCAYVLNYDSNVKPPTNFRAVRFANSVWGDDYLIIYKIGVSDLK